jgi:hypothetical protein
MCNGGKIYPSCNNIETSLFVQQMSKDYEYDEVVVNLKVIGSIVVNTKLYTKGTYLNIEQPMMIPESFRRWYRQDSRDDAIKRIDRTISKAASYVESDKDKQMTQYLKEARIGITNMKETYSTCVQTVARLDTILDKIKAILNTVESDEE